jgi:fluoride ion exporter CrcB/FEX
MLAPLCITGSGGTTEQGGIIFADLPANMLGSFVMGVFQNGAALGVAMPMAIAWLKPYDAFQDMPILHKAITTGFCGSLTTFSGWNSAMVVLLFGTGDNRPTHIFNAVCTWFNPLHSLAYSFWSLAHSFSGCLISFYIYCLQSVISLAWKQRLVPSSWANRLHANFTK